MVKKISVDFDDTLDRKSVQNFVKEKISEGFEVWIVTSRLDNDSAPNKSWNDDLYKIANEVGIGENHVIFCNMTDKWKLMENMNFIIHLDDDWIELDLINKNLNTIGISVWGNENWVKKCNKILSHFIE